jgi:hypothetical protein
VSVFTINIPEVSVYTINIPEVRSDLHKPSKALAWVKDNCPNFIRTCGQYDTVKMQASYDFLFSEEADAVLFALRWL